MEFVILEKEIYFFGKKEKHKVLCLRFTTLEGYVVEKPLQYSAKGKDEKYYNHYVILDSEPVNTYLVKSQ